MDNQRVSNEPEEEEKDRRLREEVDSSSNRGPIMVGQVLQFAESLVEKIIAEAYEIRAANSSNQVMKQMSSHSVASTSCGVGSGSGNGNGGRLAGEL